MRFRLTEQTEFIEMGLRKVWQNCGQTTRKVRLSACDLPWLGKFASGRNKLPGTPSCELAGRSPKMLLLKALASCRKTFTYNLRFCRRASGHALHVLVLKTCELSAGAAGARLACYFCTYILRFRSRASASSSRTTLLFAYYLKLAI